ncbi:hypothetical protein DAPPUDRAFT_257981, partial [Daphnia pulex]
MVCGISPPHTTHLPSFEHPPDAPSRYWFLQPQQPESVFRQGFFQLRQSHTPRRTLSSFQPTSLPASLQSETTPSSIFSLLLEKPHSVGWMPYFRMKMTTQLHSSPKKDLHPKPRTDATDIIPFTPIDGDCRPIITPEIELADAFAGLPMISTNEEVNLPMEQGSNSLLERQMATLEDSERYNESAQPNSPMELTSFFARPVATQESSLPSLAQERSRDRSNRSINGIRKWHIEPAAGKRLKPMLIDDTDRGLGIRYTRKNGTVMWRCNFRPKKNPCHGLVSQIGDKFAEHHPHSCNPKSHHKVNVILAAEAKKYALDHLNEPAQKVVEPLIVKVLDGNPNWNPINPTTLARAVNR